MIPLSVCIPVYNGRNHLKECLDSVLSQTYKNFEVVLIDDRSSDGSFDFVRQYAAGDARFLLFQNDNNLGLAKNWNRCVELSCGEWIKFVFQDDLIEPTCIERMLNAADPKRGMIVCKRKIIFENISDDIKRIFNKQMAMPSIDDIFKGKSDIDPRHFCKVALDNLGRNFIGEPTSVMLHRRVFESLGMFNPGFTQLCDFEFWVRVGSNFGMKYVSDVLAAFRVHPNNATLINQNKYAFKSNTIDFLLLYHEFLYNSHFENLRTETVNRKLKINLKILLSLENIRAHSIAKMIDKLSSESAATHAKELRLFFRDYPKANSASTHLWSIILGPLVRYRRVLMFMYRHFFARLPHK